MLAVSLSTTTGVRAQERKAAEAVPVAIEGSAYDSAFAPVAPATPAPTSISGARLRGDARVIGFITTPYAGNKDTNGIGFGVGVNLGWGKLPFAVGFDVLTDFLGDSSSVESVQTGNTFTSVRQNRSEKAYFFDLSVRLQPSDWWARPYLEGVVGTKVLATEYTLSFANSGTSTRSVSDHDWAGSVGWGVGVDLGGISSGKVDLLIGVRRLNGGDATFSRTVDTGGQTGGVSYRTPTSATFWMLGVVGSFGRESRNP